ncbi:MAG: DNA translocase FtsK 4TM domain-containing protein, partial [Gammaproteobacteria bacterium]|nr:DNA translocase FtsK 4TM domain-containing protein [Gammaproteobacteria bacterium]
MQSTTTTRGGSLVVISINRALRESAFWVFGAVAVVLLGALATYDPSDPGFSFTGQAGEVNNIAGPAGAWIADVLYLLFGRPSFLFPVMIAYAGWLIFRARGGEGVEPQVIAWRSLGFVLTLTASAGLAALHFSGDALPSTAGGILGDLSGNGLAAGVSFLGATVLLVSVWLGGISLFLGVSWFAVMDATGRGLLLAADRAQSWYEGFKARRATRKVREARQETVREKVKVSAQRPAPRIEPVISAPVISERVERERQVPLFEPGGDHELPPLTLLNDPPDATGSYSEE